MGWTPKSLVMLIHPWYEAVMQQTCFAARCLRMMATHHIYREVIQVKPDVFTNNRISSLLDTRKPSAEIIAEYVHCLW